MKTSDSNRPTRAEIDLGVLVSNFNNIKEFIGDDTRLMAVVKADAYGHGAVDCAWALERAGIDWFGVAIPSEGVELRRSGIRKRILCLGSFWKGQVNSLLNHGLTPVIYRLDQAEAFNKGARKRNSIAEIHLKIDTGMGRIGVRPGELDEFLDKFARFENLHVEGVMTHFAAADDPEAITFTNEQIARFEDAIKAIEAREHRPVYKDLANSPATVAYPAARANLVRLGGLLYGLTGDVLPPDVDIPDLRPVMSVRTRIAHLKTVEEGEPLGYGRTFVTGRRSRIATLPIGYQDGYSRVLSNRSSVLIKGALAPVVGRVSMDWTLVDVTDIDGVEVGDEVILIGENSGVSVSAEDLAAFSDTISYEITCGINRRVTRVYVDSSEE
ncbi:MAG: alanine racemase [Acidobacteria bacterium]|nr:MAG: alanine racemase [Acidobacteriota bacterium]REK01312.1 MAG: alanine racemase [Acidobacteriota bacterium]REK14268.1 MAG: alanine racemase [Acidobacteriota bacterium]REK44983.1 MAG: alanine racemase [Acidobacteriota bacterium]